MRTGADLTAFEEGIGEAWERAVARKKAQNNLTRQKDIAEALGHTADALCKMKSGIQRTTTTDIYLAVQLLGITEPLEELARQCGYEIAPLGTAAAANKDRIQRTHLDVMREAHDAMQKFAERQADGELDAADRLALAPEFAELANAANRMAKELGKI